MDILISTIFDKCQRLSSYEAGRGSTVSDDLYSIVHITDRDSLFLADAIEQAAGSVASILRFAISDYNITQTKVTFDVVSDSSLNYPPNTKFLEEIIATYCMAVWLDNKLPERARSYMGMYTELINRMVKKVCRKRPILEADDNNN